MSGNWDEQEQLFDLLADGELDEERRRQLLKQLDHVPDGWRRCALAFLQHQAYREAARRALDALRNPAEPGGKNLAAARRSLWRRQTPWVYWVSLAASVMVGFGLALVADRLFPNRAALPTVAQAPISESEQRIPVAREQDGVPWDTVTVVMGDPASRQTRAFEVPVFSGESLNASTLAALPSVVPGEVLEALKLRGHRYERRREFWPAKMNDGTDFVIPVETILVNPDSATYY